MLTHSSRQERLCTELKQHTLSYDQVGLVVKLGDLDQTQARSNEDHTVLEIHDILRSYYKVALERFIDCVRMQVADTLLVTGQETPLTVFSSTFVTGMTPEALRMLLERIGLSNVAEIAWKSSSDSSMKEK